MLDNFAYLIDTIGHIPNGNRTYYLSRSQPPFFSYMVELAAQKEGGRVYQKYLPQLRTRIRVLDAGRRTRSQPGDAARNVVMLPDGTVLNRYWDERDTPRDESYLGRRQHREAGAEPRAERGLSRPARGGRKRLGLQLALVRRQPDARDDPHDVDHSRRSEQPDVPPRNDDRARLRRGARLRLRRRVHRTRGEARATASTSICGTRTATTATTTGSSASRATTYRRRRSIRSSRMRRGPSARTGRRATIEAQLLQARRPRDDHLQHDAAMGRAERLGAAALDRGRRGSSAMAAPNSRSRSARAFSPT